MQAFLFTSIAHGIEDNINNSLRVPMRFGSLPAKIIPQPVSGSNWTFSDLRPASYIEDSSVPNLITTAKKQHIIDTREAKLLAGDFAIQALNKIVSQKLSMDVSELVPILEDFERESYDRTGVTLNLIRFLTENPVISRKNLSGLVKRLEDVNNLNERTELSIRFPRHQPGYDLLGPIQSVIFRLSIFSKEAGLSEQDFINQIRDLLLNRAATLFKLVESRLSERKIRGYKKALPTMSISEAAEWRRGLYEIVSNLRDKDIEYLMKKAEYTINI